MRWRIGVTTYDMSTELKVFITIEYDIYLASDELSAFIHCRNFFDVLSKFDVFSTLKMSSTNVGGDIDGKMSHRVISFLFKINFEEFKSFFEPEIFLSCPLNLLLLDILN